MFPKITFALACALVIGTAATASAQYRGYGYGYGHSGPSYGYGMDVPDRRYGYTSAYRYRSAPMEQGYYYAETPSYGYWQSHRLINRHAGEQ